MGDCFSVSKQVSKAFLAGEFDQIVVAYTNFVSVLAQTPAAMQLLPLKKPEKKEAVNRGDILYEGDSEEVFAAIIPEYLGGVHLRCAVRKPRLRSRLPAGLPWIPRPRTPTI